MNDGARPHRRPSRASIVARRLAGLGLVLLVLYYLVAQTVLIRSLSRDLADAQARTAAAEVEAVQQREDLEARLDTLQVDLDEARAEVQALREQLIREGLTPVAPTTAPEPAQDAPAEPAPTVEAQDAPAPVQEASTPAPAPAPTPEPAPPAPSPEPAPEAPAPAPDRAILGCVLFVCL